MDAQGKPALLLRIEMHVTVQATGSDLPLMSKPRILHIGKFYVPNCGGIETHVHDLAVRQAQVAAVSVLASNCMARTEISEIEGVRVIRLANFGTIASMPISPSLRSALRRTPAEIVHVHLPNPASALAFITSGHPGKLIITHHADTMGRKNLRRISDPFVHRLMQMASRIIVTSDRYLRSSEELRPYRDKCSVIPLGISIDATCPSNTRELSHLRRRREERLVLAIGRLVPYKGFDVLIRAMKRVHARLALIGTGPQADWLLELARREGVRDKIAMLGWIDDLRCFLRQASIFVMPSVTRAEAFGLVQLEAMAAGLPIINTNLDSGVPEVSVNGVTGFTVPPGDVAALSNAISLLLDRKDLRQQFGDAAMERAASFSADTMSDRTMALYEQVLAA